MKQMTRVLERGFIFRCSMCENKFQTTREDVPIGDLLRKFCCPVCGAQNHPKEITPYIIEEDLDDTRYFNSKPFLRFR